MSAVLDISSIIIIHSGYEKDSNMHVYVHGQDYGPEVQSEV